MFWSSSSVAKAAACGSATCESQGPVACRPLSTDEELWCRAMEMGTGLCIVGLQFSGQLSMNQVQRAAQDLALKFPFLLARVVGQGKIGGPLELHLCHDPKPITVAARSLADVAAWEAAAPLDNDLESGPDGEGPAADVAKKNPASDADGKEEENKEQQEEEEDEEFMDADSGDGDADADGSGDDCGDLHSRLKDAGESDDLHRIVEMEMNQPITASHGEAPADALQIHAYQLPRSTCLALRCHRAVVDRSSVRLLTSILISAIHLITAGQSAAADGGAVHLSRQEDPVSLPPPLSSLLPTPATSRSYLSKSLSQAYDTMAYVRNAIASSRPPFQAGRTDYRTNEFRSYFRFLRFGREDTGALLSSLAAHACSLFSLQCAAALKAVADVKQLGGKTETFNVTSIMNCRPFLEPSLPPDTVGVFTSGLPLKHPISQDVSLWDVARAIDADLAAAVGQKKQFTDMPVLELLFSTAMKTPTFSPECSLRTSFLSAITESPFHLEWPASCMGDAVAGGGVSDPGGGGAGGSESLERVIGPVFATHGVGPSVSIVDSLQDGQLQVYINFVVPLFSRDFITRFLKLFQHYFEEAASQ